MAYGDRQSSSDISLPALNTYGELSPIISFSYASTNGTNVWIKTENFDFGVNNLSSYLLSNGSFDLAQSFQFIGVDSYFNYDGSLYLLNFGDTPEIAAYNELTLARQSSQDITLPLLPRPISHGSDTNGTYLWILTADVLRAVNFPSGTRAEAQDIALPSVTSSGSWHGVWIDRTNNRIYVNYDGDFVNNAWINPKVYVFDLSTRNRLPNLDIDLSTSAFGTVFGNNNLFYAANWAGFGTSLTLNAYDIQTQAPGPPIRKSTDLVKRFCGSQAIGKVYLGARLVFEQGTPPAITSLTANPSSIDLDTRASGNVTVNFGVTNSTHNRLYNTRSGANVPLTTSTSAVFAQPQQPTTYRLVCQNAVGSISRDVEVDVTKNPTIASLRRTGFLRHILGGGTSTYEFGATITGLPMPTLRYQFSSGEQGAINPRHLRQGANPYTWTLDWSIVLNSDAARRLTITATNASGTATSTIANINA